MNDIVERLRIPVDHQDDWIIGTNKLMNEAADEIERRKFDWLQWRAETVRLNAEIKWLRSALEFYAKPDNYKQFIPHGKSFAVAEILIDGGEKARAALEQK